MSDLQPVKEGLVIYDFLTYKSQSRKKLSKNTAENTKKMGMVLKAIYGGMTAEERAIFMELKEMVDNYHTDEDLKPTLKYVAARQDLSPVSKRVIKEALVIYDFLCYKSQSRKRLSKKTAANTKEQGMVLKAVEGGLDKEERALVKELGAEELGIYGNDGDLAFLVVDDILEEKISEREALGAGSVIHDQLKLALELRIGHSSAPHNTEIPAHLRPAAENVPNFSAELRFGNPDNIDRRDDYVTLIGRDNPLMAETRGFEALMNLKVGYRGLYPDIYEPEAKKTTLVDFGAGLAFRLHLKESGFIELYGNYALDYNDYQAPNEIFYNGMGHLLIPGLAGEVLGTDLFSLRMFGEYDLGWFSYDDSTFGYPITDTEQLVFKYGGRLSLDLSNASTSAPDIAYKVAFSHMGLIGQPVAVPEDDTTSPGSPSDDAKSIGMDLSFYWSKAPSGFVLQGKYFQQNRKRDEAYHISREVQAGLGFNTGEDGSITLNYIWSENPAQLYGGEQMGGALTWALPFLNGAFSLAGRVDAFDEIVVGGGYLGFDPFKIAPNPNRAGAR